MKAIENPSYCFFLDLSSRVCIIAAPRNSSLGQTPTMVQDKLTIDYSKDTIIQQDNKNEKRKQVTSDVLNASSYSFPFSQLPL